MFFRHFALLVILVAFVGLLYGIYNIFLEVEVNTCRMTYMFGNPQFSRVNVEENHKFPYYGMYYYYEGNIQRSINDIELYGAPIIFVPGNAGSAKQVRSLASVAIKKGVDNNLNVHYFTIDYNEELSALYGGYLVRQKEFLKLCIISVLKLYRQTEKTQQVILIGHSMGGVIAQAVLDDQQIAGLVNTVIFISTPLSKPVLNIDWKINEFYENIYGILHNNRRSNKIDNDQNVCRDNKAFSFGKVRNPWENIMLLSIGGGNRDLLVQDKLTTSQFSDIHAMTSSIPEVYLSCDHLASVWCLQLILVINRFIFKILWKVEGTNITKFREEKLSRLQAASHFFVRSKSRHNFLNFHVKYKEVPENAWHEDSKRVVNKKFNNGIKRTYNQLIQIEKLTSYQKLYIQVSNVEEGNWLYGCVSQVKLAKHICINGTTASHIIQHAPSQNGEISIALLDLNNIRKTYDWTHIVVRLHPTNKKVNMNIDAYELAKRHFEIALPSLFDFYKRILVNETIQGSLYYKVLVKNLDDTFQSLRIDIVPNACLGQTFSVTTKICVPWARGFERYNVLSKNSKDNSIYVNVPLSTPPGYNTTKNPVIVEIFLDPVCRYRISYQLSIGNMCSRFIHEFYQWLPAHFASVLFIVLKNQISKIHKTEDTIVRPYTGFFQSISLYIITGCRLLKKFLLSVGYLSLIDVSEHSLIVSLFVHAVAITLSIIASFLTWITVTLHGNFLQSLAIRLTNIRPITSSTLVYIMSNLPVSFGVLVIAVAFVNSGFALILTIIYYFILLSNAYKDYLENSVMKTTTGFVKGILRKQFVRATIKQSSALSCDMGSEAVLLSGSNKPGNSKEADANESHSIIGLCNFSYHITLLILMCLVAFLNINITIAWAKNRGIMAFMDPSLWPIVVILGSISLLWQLNAPNQLFGSQVLSVILYICACCCVIYCQEAMYRLNYVVSFAFSALLFFEVLSRICKRLRTFYA